MKHFLFTTLLGALLVCSATSVLALELSPPTLAERLETSSSETREAAIQEVIHLATFERHSLDASAVVPVLLSIARSDDSPQIRLMASQAVVVAGTRSDVRELHRIARQEHNPRVQRLMRLAANSVVRR